jgi:hypothetical protein
MEINSILKNISKDVAKVQHESDVLSQWPINSVEAMYYSGPFLIPEIGKNFLGWENDPQALFEKGLMPGKLAGLIFYFLNEKAKEKMGKDNHKNLLRGIISKIMLFKKDNYLEDYTSESWMPEWNFDTDSKKVDVKKLVFLLDNLTEMINPIFRSNGVQLFFDDNNIYRYYYRLDLNKKIIIVSPKQGMKIDFFEHIIEPENLDQSQVFIEDGGKIIEGESDILFNEVKNKINELKNSRDFNREYVINQIFDAFDFDVPEAQKGFLKTPFPEEIVKFYMKTCDIPEDKLSQGIYHILGGS